MNKSNIDSLDLVDVVFIIDTTASMGPYIEEAKARVKDILNSIQKSNGLSIQVGLIEYRDHPPQDTTFINRVYPLGCIEEFHKNLITLYPYGGGDLPEAVWPAIDQLNKISWRQNSDRQVFIILDSPPHGYAAYGDGFPLGDPSGLTQLDIIRTLTNLNISFNAHSIAGNTDTTNAIKPLVDATQGALTEGATPQAGTTMCGIKLSSTAGSITNAKFFYNSVVGKYGTYNSSNARGYAASVGMKEDILVNITNYLSKRGIKEETSKDE